MNESEKPETMICYGGVYANVSDAKSDFDVIKAAHKESWIGTYDAALFEKNTDGKVKVLDTDATQRGKGARSERSPAQCSRSSSRRRSWFPRAWAPPPAPLSAT